MSCRCKSNGATYLNEIMPLPAAAASTTATYVIDLTHYLCGNRKICINSAYPPAADLKYQVQEVVGVGNGAYNATILCTGTLTYQPYYHNCANGCTPCPVSEGIVCQFTVPVTSATAPTLTAGSCVVSPANVQECCTLCNAVQMEASLIVAPA